MSDSEYSQFSLTNSSEQVEEREEETEEGEKSEEPEVEEEDEDNLVMSIKQLYTRKISTPEYYEQEKKAKDLIFRLILKKFGDACLNQDQWYQSFRLCAEREPFPKPTMTGPLPADEFHLVAVGHGEAVSVQRMRFLRRDGSHLRIQNSEEVVSAPLMLNKLSGRDLKIWLQTIGECKTIVSGLRAMNVYGNRLMPFPDLLDLFLPRLSSDSEDLYEGDDENLDEGRNKCSLRFSILEFAMRVSREDLGGYKINRYHACQEPIGLYDYYFQVEDVSWRPKEDY